MDDSDGIGISFARNFHYFHSECSGSTVYLYSILNMVKIFKRLNRFIRIVINTLVRLILGVVYFILFFPFAIFAKLCTDFLEIKRKPPCWIPHNKIENVKKFLTHQ